MQYDKTVGNVNIKVNTTRLDRNTMEAQKLLNIQVVEDSNNLIPFQQGALRGSVRYPEGLYGGVISWGKRILHMHTISMKGNCILQRMDVHMLIRENRNIPPVHL